MKQLLFLLSLAQIGFALDMSRGEWGSGGGNAIVCFNKAEYAQEVEQNNFIVEDHLLENITFIEMFDLHQAKLPRGLAADKPQIIEIKSNEKYESYFLRLSKRFENLSLFMSDTFKLSTELVPHENFVWHDTYVNHISDLGNHIKPKKNCVVTTMANQVSLSGYFLVHIDRRLFEHPLHSKQSRATLLIHEYVYSVLRNKFSHKDSAATREVVRYLISYDGQTSVGKLAKALHSFNIKYYPYGFSISDKTNIYDSIPLYQEYYSAVQSFNDISIDIFYSKDFLMPKLKDSEKICKQILETCHNLSNFISNGGISTPRYYDLLNFISKRVEESNPAKIAIWNKFKQSVLDSIQSRIDEYDHLFKNIILFDGIHLSSLSKKEIKLFKNRIYGTKISDILYDHYGKPGIINEEERPVEVLDIIKQTIWRSSGASQPYQLSFFLDYLMGEDLGVLKFEKIIPLSPIK